AADAQPGGGRVSRVLVFVNSKKRTDELTRELRADGWPALGLHGDKRGLDIPNVGAVVNFDMPPTIDAYVHRVGRTGRAGACGSAYTLWVADGPERTIARELAALLAASGQPVPADILHAP
ncbi:P-loop containing nucleoside triphosphate hydrolase protein, partial [Pavlovales sp. CCMP2436]